MTDTLSDTHVKTNNRHHSLPNEQRTPDVPPRIDWAAPAPQQRGPVIASTSRAEHRNVIGAYGGGYAIYRALAIANGDLNPAHRPDLTNTAPTFDIGPYPRWSEAGKIVSLDPWGHKVGEVFREYLERGCDVRPTIAVTRAHIAVPEIEAAISTGRIPVDGSVVVSPSNIAVTKIAIEPVWYLPGVAARLDVVESDLRRALFEHTGGMYPELVSRPDLKVFLPPIGGTTVYCFGDPDKLAKPGTKIACRVHDECNGSDVFGSDICTCRPYLVQGIEAAVAMAQAGGAGLVVYNRKEGRSLGEVTKFLVYNARKRAAGGDRPEDYFKRTECVAGVQDMRFQQLMPDVFHWLGVAHIDQLVSMSDSKYDALIDAGISIGDRIEIPPDLVPADAHVELEAKMTAGYYNRSRKRALATSVHGRGLFE